MAYGRDSPRFQGVRGQRHHLRCLHPGHPHPPGVTHHLYWSYQGPDHQRRLAQTTRTCRAPGHPAELRGDLAVDGRLVAVLDRLVRPKVIWQHFSLPQCFGRAAHGRHQPQHRHRSMHHVGMNCQQHLWLAQCPSVVRPSTVNRVRETTEVPCRSEQLGESH